MLYGKTADEKVSNWLFPRRQRPILRKGRLTRPSNTQHFKSGLMDILALPHIDIKILEKLISALERDTEDPIIIEHLEHELFVTAWT